MGVDTQQENGDGFLRLRSFLAPLNKPLILNVGLNFNSLKMIYIC